MIHTLLQNDLTTLLQTLEKLPEDAATREAQALVRKIVSDMELSFPSGNLQSNNPSELGEAFVRKLRHDLRNPIGTIIGMGNLLHTEGAEGIEDIKDIGKLIEECGNKLLDLLERNAQEYVV